MRKVARLLVLLTVIIVATGCARYGYKLYPGPARPASELVRLTLGRGLHSVEVDGFRVTRSDYDFVELTPGRHEISWRPSLGMGWWETQDDREELNAVVIVELSAGQEYSVHCDFAYNLTLWLLATERERTYLWVEHNRTGAVVGGEKKP